jgi:streptomycin 6-kinase
MSDSTLPLPRSLVEAAQQEGRTAWLATLPGTVARLARTWSLTVEAPFQPGGQTAWVAPVRNRAGDERVLKVASRHPEAEHEADGLRAWAGHGAAAGREPWLVVDPKPHVSRDASYDGVQHLLNCTERLQTDPVGLADRMAGLLEVDAVRLRRWLFARCVLESPGEPVLADVARRLPID